MLAVLRTLWRPQFNIRMNAFKSVGPNLSRSLRCSPAHWLHAKAAAAHTSAPRITATSYRPTTHTPRRSHSLHSPAAAAAVMALEMAMPRGAAAAAARCATAGRAPVRPIMAALHRAVRTKAGAMRPSCRDRKRVVVKVGRARGAGCGRLALAILLGCRPRASCRYLTGLWPRFSGTGIPGLPLVVPLL